MTQNNSDNNGKSSKNKNPCKNQIRKFKKQITELEERLEIEDIKRQEAEWSLEEKKDEIKDLKSQIDLKNVEIDELNQDAKEKDEKISKYKNTLLKSKYEKEQLEWKIKNEINNEKSKLKELDELDKKIKEKEAIIEDKQD